MLDVLIIAHNNPRRDFSSARRREISLWRVNTRTTKSKLHCDVHVAISSICLHTVLKTDRDVLDVLTSAPNRPKRFYYTWQVREVLMSLAATSTLIAKLECNVHVVIYSISHQLILRVV